jgi:hypothetical protein
MNDDTSLVFEGIENDETLYSEAESAANYAGTVATDAEEFYTELASELERIATDNRDALPGFSNSEPIEYENVDYDEMARLYDYDTYRG